MTWRYTFWPIRVARGSWLAGVLGLLLWLGTTATATAVVVDEADDVCAPSADPCVITEPIEIADGATLDFGTRALEIEPGGYIDVGPRTATVLCGSLTALVGRHLALMAGSPDSPLGQLTIEARRACSGDPSIACLEDADCGAGTCSLGGGSIDIDARIEMHGTQSTGGFFTPETILLRAAGPIDIDGSVSGNASNAFSQGRSFGAESRMGSVSVGGSIRMHGGDEGGHLDLEAAGDIVVDAAIDVHGGAFGGGFVRVRAGQDATITRNMRLESQGGGGHGGRLIVDAGGNIGFDESVTLRLRGSRGRFSASGSAGDLELEAGGNVSLPAGVAVLMSGGGRNSIGGSVEILAVGDVSLGAKVRATGRGGEGGGGSVEVATAGQVDVLEAALLDLRGHKGGGGEVTLAGDAGVDFSGRIKLQGAPTWFAGPAVLSSSAGDVVIDGAIVTSGSITFTGTGERHVDVTGCDVTLGAGAHVEVIARAPKIFLTGRESVTLATGSRTRARARGEIPLVELRYRQPGVPPIVAGSVSPEPTLTLDTGLTACP